MTSTSDEQSQAQVTTPTMTTTRSRDEEEQSTVQFLKATTELITSSDAVTVPTSSGQISSRLASIDFNSKSTTDASIEVSSITSPPRETEGESSRLPMRIQQHPRRRSVSVTRHVHLAWNRSWLNISFPFISFLFSSLLVNGDGQWIVWLCRSSLSPVFRWLRCALERETVAWLSSIFSHFFHLINSNCLLIFSFNKTRTTSESSDCHSMVFRFTRLSPERFFPLNSLHQ